MQEDLNPLPMTNSWPGRDEALLGLAERLLDTIETITERLTTAVEHAEALRAAQDASRSPSTVPTEKPRTGALSDAQGFCCARCGEDNTVRAEWSWLAGEGWVCARCLEVEARDAQHNTLRTEAINALHEALADCPGLSPQEMQELHPECFEADQQALSDAQKLVEHTSRGGWSACNHLILESPSDQNNTLLTGSKRGIPQDAMGYVSRDETGTWRYQHVRGEHPTMTQIDGMIEQARKGWLNRGQTDHKTGTGE